MSFPNWSTQPELVFSKSPIMPVIVIKELGQAIPLAQALIDGGVPILEVTLRTPIALEAVSLLTKTFPEAFIGVGTVTTPQHLVQAVDAGAQFALSPGCTQELLEAGVKSRIPFIPGIATVSELMQGLALGYTHFKFFPAAASGGTSFLKAVHSPFPQARFCPTGGINALNASEYLALPNVSCVGGSWVVPEEAIARGNWSLIKQLCLSVSGLGQGPTDG